MSTNSCPNPLFLQWITEWYEDAKHRNLQIQHVYKKAQQSLQEHPSRLETAQEATKLSGIGQKISDKLAKRLTQWRKAQGIPEPVVVVVENTEMPVLPIAKQTTRPYIPRYRSGAFALILGLYKSYCLYGTDYYTPKTELIALSQPFTDTPFQPNGGFNSMHSAWNGGIKILETRGLADRQGRVKFALTEDGVEIAEKVVGVLRARNELTEEDAVVFEKAAADDIETGSAAAKAQTLFRTQSTTIATLPRTHPACLPRHHSAAGFSRQSSTGIGIELSELIHYPPESFDIILLVDTREIHSPADRDLIDRELKDKDNIKTEIRSLPLGDYLWIARAKPSGAYRHLPDVVLDYVVERKRMDDLCASIRDGRYREQHSRINACNFTNVLYIVEGDDPEAVRRIGESSVDSAISRVQVREKYHLKRPKSFVDTLKMLRQTTGIIHKALQGGGGLHAIPDRLVGQREFARLKSTLRTKFPRCHLGMSFDAYETVSSKSAAMGVGEIYLRLLMTVRGCSVNQALAIGSRYPSPSKLLDALSQTDDAKQRQKLVAELVMPNGRKVGPAVARRLAEFWTLCEFI